MVFQTYLISNIQYRLSVTLMGLNETIDRLKDNWEVWVKIRRVKSSFYPSLRPQKSNPKTLGCFNFSTNKTDSSLIYLWWATVCYCKLPGIFKSDLEFLWSKVKVQQIFLLSIYCIVMKRQNFWNYSIMSGHSFEHLIKKKPCYKITFIRKIKVFNDVNFDPVSKFF